ncbi:MAG: hypothetical protein UY41_C0005G0014 [Candidatus Moranbacteria bacterium GW2011_GWE1_49_15]|nr:MAG: hypothetical protein UX75_C0001G0019 [Candidatus Moranbacteria bacterium GW2011_GWE2_47_10]KKW07337.1 MAG: hypothetical protein UY41_C0005G0014 [Candidatus Moranbacteria bacterium GW2011_GWE1_49_15]
MGRLMENKNIDLKEFFLDSLFVLGIVAIYVLFPTNDFFQQIITLVVFFIGMPILYCKFITGRKLYSFGISKGDVRNGLFWSLGLFSVALLALYVVFNYSSFLSNYGLPRDIIDNFTYFVLYESFFILPLSFIYTFFFIGFVYFGHERVISGYWAIVLQWIIFIGIVLLSGSSFWVSLPYLLFAPFAGLIAYKSRSIWYSALTQFIFVFVVDIFFIKFTF